MVWEKGSIIMTLILSPSPAEHREPEHGSFDGPSTAPRRSHGRPGVRARAISRRLFVRGAAGAAALAVGPGLGPVGHPNRLDISRTHD